MKAEKPQPGETWENVNRKGDFVTVDEITNEDVLGKCVKYHRDHCPCCHKYVESGRKIDQFLRMYQKVES